MALNVQYLSEEEIERNAEELLREFCGVRGQSVWVPVPIEDVIEKHLGLGVDFDDLHSVLDLPQIGAEPDVFAAIWVDRKHIVIDQSLDPDENPDIEGRYRFTLAHEAAHWLLHRQYLTRSSAQASLLKDQGAPAVICRSTEANKRVEWQANYHASCLLMPRKIVLSCWQRQFRTLRAVIFENCRDRPAAMRPAYNGLRSIGHASGDVFEAEHDYLFNKIAGLFDWKFGVSRQAMRIRLEKLGLLLEKAPRQRVFEEID